MALTQITEKGIKDGEILNADINASAAIAGTKISPDFGSQNIVTTGFITSNDITISDTSPTINFTDSNNDSDFKITNDGGLFKISDRTNNNADRIAIHSDGEVDLYGHVDIGAGLDVTGNISCTGTVDGVDIAALNTTVGNITTDVVSDTSPQLGAALDTNGYNIAFGDSTGNGNTVNRLTFGTKTHGDLQIYHDGSNSYITDRGTGELRLYAAETLRIRDTDSGEEMITCNKNGSVDLYHNNVKKFETGTNYSVVTSISNGNPAGLKVTNSDANSNYSHAELRLISKNGASYGVIYNDHANSNVRIGHNTTGNTLEVYNDGDIRAQGLRFGSDTAAANTLDDYEEGTFTPALSYRSVSAAPTMTSQTGQYTKIGNCVFFHLRINLSNNGSGSGNLTVTGLPFNVHSSTIGNQQVVGTPIVDMDLGGDRELFVQFEGSGNTLFCYSFAIESSNNYSDVTVSNVGNGLNFSVQGHYFTNQ